jgi:uncharacterized membrane protein YsdA (DUF1294 family)
MWFLPITFGLAVGMALLVACLLHIDGLAAWLTGVNTATALAYAYDKVTAGSGRTRVPERVLRMLALAGATPAAYISIRLLRHKTAKVSFQLRFWLIAAAQAVLVAGYLTLFVPRLAAR